MTSYNYLETLFAEKGVKPTTFAPRVGLSPSAFSKWKLLGTPVSLERLVDILLGLGYTKQDHQYLEMIARYTAERTGSVENPRLALRIGSAESAKSKQDHDALTRLLDVASKLSHRDKEVLIQALQHPESLRLWLQSVQAFLPAPSPTPVKKKK